MSAHGWAVNGIVFPDFWGAYKAAKQAAPMGAVSIRKVVVS